MKTDSYFSHGDVTPDKVYKMSNTRPLIVCVNCLSKAERETVQEQMTFEALGDILQCLERVVDTSSSRNSERQATIMHRLASTQSSALDSEIQSEIKTCRNHEMLKKESCELLFLSKTNRNQVLVKTLLGFANFDSNFTLQLLTEKKLYALCSAYEAILSLKHSLVTTAPAVMRNLRLYKTTQKRDLLETIGAPSGGKHTTLTNVINEDLPTLLPPTNDFITCDDNLQVKRVCSSSKLKEKFKFTVKVVNSHVHFQNTSDKNSSVLKNKDNQPKNWLKKPAKVQIEDFEGKIVTYEREARKVRSNLVESWLSEELTDLKENRDPVARLSRLRRSRLSEHVLYPCPNCGGEGRLRLIIRNN